MISNIVPPPSLSPATSQQYAKDLLTWDILCGNEKCFDSHTGNIRYQDVLNKVRPAYMSLESKAAKKKLVRDVDEFIQSYGGRFLRVEEGSDKMRIMTTAESRNKISRSLREAPTQQKNAKVYVSRITELDVLCGRGGKANHHLGNKLYRKLVCDAKEKYRNTSDKDEKTDMSRSIVDQVFAYGGKFVKKDPGSSRFYVLTKAEARIKTSQALRENRDSKSDASCDDSDSDDASIQTSPQTAVSNTGSTKSTDLENDKLACCVALVNLSRVVSS